MNKPQVIANRFSIQDFIGQGGMGDVYRGVDTQTGDAVAIKHLKADAIADSPEMVERFQREGEALRRLNHPNIVKMLAAVQEDGQYYLVMEYVGGGSLRDLMTETHQLPIDQVLNIALDLSDALSRTHRLKIIHRDLKPANVLMAEDGTPRLTDFGVAHMGDRSRVTESGALVGTYAYMSPESCMGEDLDERTDIWSFGVMLYEMVAGRRPFEANAPAAVLTAILTRPVPDLTQYRSDVPPALLGLIYAMLEKDRDKRISSVRLVGAQLEAFAKGSDTAVDRMERLFAQPEQPTPTFSTTFPHAAPAPEDAPTALTPTPSFVSRAALSAEAEAVAQPVAPPRRTRFRWWMVPVVIVTVLVLGGGLLLASIKSPPPAPTATPGGAIAPTPIPSDQFLVLVAQPEHLGGQERDVQRFIVQNLQDTFQDAVAPPNLIVAPYPAVITTEQAAREAAEERGATVIVWGNYNAERVELTVQIGTIEQVPHLTMPREYIDPISSLRVRLTDEHSQSIAPQVLAIQNALNLASGNAFEAIRLGVIFRDMNAPSAELVERNTASANWFRSIPSFFSDAPDMLDAFNEALARAPANPLLLGWRATAYFRLGRFDDALRDLDDADSRLSQPWAWSVMVRGGVDLLQNKLDKAIDEYTTAVQLQPDSWYPYYFRGTIYYARKQYDLARADMEKAISYNPPVNFPYAFAAMLAVRDARLIEAQNLFKTIKLRFPDPKLGVDFVSAAANTETQKRFPVNLGALIGAFGHITLRQYDKVISDMDALIASNPNLAEAYGIQGIAYCNYQKQYAAAEAAYTKGIAIDPNLSLLYALRAEVRLKQNNALGGVADGAAAARSPQGAIYLQLMPLIQKGELGCENLFDYDLSKIATAPPAALPTVTPPASLALDGTAEATAP